MSSSTLGRTWKARWAGLAAALGVAVSAFAGEAPKEVRLGYFANVTHAQGVLGVASGEFEKAVAPSKFSTKTFNAGPTLVEALFAGEIDVGYIGPSPALNAYIQSKGEGIRVIAGAAANGVVIVAAPGSGIEKIEDLKGKRIATPQLGNTQDVSARHYLLHVLKQKDTTNVVPVPNAEQASMMQRGEIDAAWAVEPWGARLEIEAGAKVIAEEKDLWPSKQFTLTLVITTPKFLKEHPETIEKILGVHADWTARLNEDAQKYAPEIGKAIEGITGKPLSTDVISKALSRVKFSNDPLPESIETFGQWAVDVGYAKATAKADKMVDRTLLDKVLAARPAKTTDATPAAPAGEPAGSPEPAAVLTEHETLGSEPASAGITR